MRCVNHPVGFVGLSKNNRERVPLAWTHTSSSGWVNDCQGLWSGAPHGRPCAISQENQRIKFSGESFQVVVWTAGGGYGSHFSYKTRVMGTLVPGFRNG